MNGKSNVENEFVENEYICVECRCCINSNRHSLLMQSMTFFEQMAAVGLVDIVHKYFELCFKRIVQFVQICLLKKNKSKARNLIFKLNQKLSSVKCNSLHFMWQSIKLWIVWMNYLATDASNNHLLADLLSALAIFCVSLDTFELFLCICVLLLLLELLLFLLHLLFVVCSASRRCSMKLLLV